MIEKVKISGYRTFEMFEFRPNRGFNLLVGANESGKSTILEAMVLALTGRINSRWASEELNPFWFNKNIVDRFIEHRKNGKKVAPPEIGIELFLENLDDLQRLSGANNTDTLTNACPGVSMRIALTPCCTTIFL